MFEPLPNNANGVVLLSADAVLVENVYDAISEAKAKSDEVQCRLDELTKSATEEELANGWPEHAISKESDEAKLARIKAVLLSAIFVEGAVNAWGVYIAGEKFFKAHIERCKIESKIALTLALDGKGCIPKNHSVIIAIRDLFDRRNQIAHRKTKEWQGDYHPSHIREEKADGDLAACKKAIDEFCQFLIQVDKTVAFMAGAISGDGAP